MPSIILKATWLLVGCVGLTLTTFVCTYPISVYACKDGSECVGHNGEYFLSNTINYPYASCIGSFVLSLGAFLLAAVMLMRYFQHETLMDDTAEGHPLADKIDNMRKVNKAGVFAGVLSMIGAIGVCSFQLSAIETIHYLFAGLFFGAGFVSLTCFMHIDVQYAQTAGAYQGMLLLRLGAVVLSALCIFIWGVLSITLTDYNSDSYAAPAATCEITIFLCFEVILSSWYSDFKELSLTLSPYTPSAEYDAVA